MAYFDGFVTPVAHDRKDAYLAFAKEHWPMFKGWGATRQVECWGDDVPHGKLTDFFRAVDAKDGEAVAFSWLEWPDKATRDAAMEKMKAAGDQMQMPFDGQRMIYGGFAPVVDLGTSEATPGYVDGFVLAAPSADKQKFIDHANQGNGVFIDAGATRCRENWGDDVPEGKVTDLQRAVASHADETVCFSWVEWPDKATRDASMARMEAAMKDPSKADPRMDPAKNPMPFDGQRMIFGGFTPIFDSKGE